MPEAPTLVPEVKPPKPEDIADAPLEPALIDRLVDAWANDPTPEQRAAFDQGRYTDLSRTMLARCMAALAEEIWPVYAACTASCAT